MHCPACKTTILAMTERQGIEIDYCPQCRGIWLDRGELDRLLARAEADAPASSHAGSRSAPPSPPRHDSHRHGQGDPDFGIEEGVHVGRQVGVRREGATGGVQAASARAVRD